MKLFQKEKENKEAAPITRATLMRSVVATAGILMVLSVAVTAYITTAWFSMNRNVDGDGVHMNMETSPNLIISDLTNSAADKAAFQALTVATADTRITFTDPTDPDTLLTPVTHKSDSASGLKYLTNPSAVSRDSGLSAGTALTLAAAANTGTAGDPIYYLEHTVRIASTDKVLPTDELRATFSGYTSTPGDNPTLLDYQYATSVDFYAVAVSANDYTTAVTPSSSTYKGTLNLAKKDSVKWNIDSATAGAANDKTYVVLYTNDIPLNSATGAENCCIVVTMRFYFDGALLKTQDLDGVAPDNNQTYVRSSGLSTTGMPYLYVNFEAVGSDT